MTAAEQARAEMRAYIRRVVDEAPPFDEEDRAAIAAILQTGREAAQIAEAQQKSAEQQKAQEREERERQYAAREAEENRLRAAARCALYRHYDAEDVLLYVGISGVTQLRRDQHRRAAWWRFQDREEVEYLPDRAAALAAEASAIRAEQPIFNIAGAADGARERRIRYLIARDALDMLSDRTNS